MIKRLIPGGRGREEQEGNHIPINIVVSFQIKKNAFTHSMTCFLDAIETHHDIIFYFRNTLLFIS